jgi:hypothetical protein
VESSDVEISIKRSVQRSSSSKIIVIDHDIAINDDIDESLQRNEGEINFAEEDGEDNGSRSSSSVQLVSRSVSAAPVYVEFSNIRKSVQRSSSSKKIIVIDHDDNDESLKRNEGGFNFAEDGEDNGSSSVQLVSRSIIAAPAYVDEVKESESSEDDDKTLELKLEEDDDKSLELKLEY